MTDIPLPQTPHDSRQVARSINEDGVIQFEQVGFQELDFGAVFGGKTTSTSENTIGYGLQTFTLDIDDGKIIRGCKVEITSLDDPDCWEIGIVASKDLTVSPAAITVFIKKISPLTNTSRNWEIQIVDDAAANVSMLGYSADSKQFGSSHDIFVGATLSLTTDAKKIFTSGSHIIGESLADGTQYFRGISQAYNASTGALTLFITDIGPTATGTIAAWSLFAQDGPSVNSVTIGTSSTSVTLSAAGQTIALTTQSGKLWAEGSTQLVYSQSNAGVYFFGRVTSYSGTTLTMTRIDQSVFATADDWIITQGMPYLWGLAGGDYSTNPNLNFTQLTPGFVTYAWFGSTGIGNILVGLNDVNLTAQRVVTWKFPDADANITYDSSIELDGQNHKLTLTADTTLNGTPVSTTGSPASGNLTKFSGANSITNGDLSGDVTTSGAMATTIKASVALAGSPTTTTQSANDNSTKIATTAYVDNKGPTTVASASFPSATNVTVAIPAGYRDIIISWSGVSFDTATRRLAIQVSTDGGSTYDTTAANYAASQVNATAGTVGASAVASVVNSADQVAAATASGTAVIHGYGTAGFKQFTSHNLTTTPSDLSLIGNYVGSTNAITNIKFLLAGSGNFDAGSYVVSVT